LDGPHEHHDASVPSSYASRNTDLLRSARYTRDGHLCNRASRRSLVRVMTSPGPVDAGDAGWVGMDGVKALGEGLAQALAGGVSVNGSGKVLHCGAIANTIKIVGSGTRVDVDNTCRAS
jgi:hypothetical protein